MSDDTTKAPQPTPEQLEAELAEQRRKLGETVDALSQKLDVKSRARDRVTEVRTQATTRVGEVRTQVVDVATDDDGRPTTAAAAAAGLLAATLVGLIVLRISRRT